jgi:hypothetical protein
MEPFVGYPDYLTNTQFMSEDYIDYPLEATCQALSFCSTCSLLAFSIAFNCCLLCQVMEIITSSKVVYFNVKNK